MNSLAKVHTKQNLFSFTEKDPGQTVGSRGFDDPTISRTDVGAFSDFFSRPIRLREYEVLEGTDFTTQFLQPWNEYFTNAQIVDKLKGFSRLRATLHIKVLVNGSPFRYGDFMLSYRPLYTTAPGATASKTSQPFFSGGHIAADIPATGYPGGQVPGATAGEPNSIMARSQRKNIHILPHLNQGGEMLLPFIHYLDAIPLVDTIATVGNVSYNYLSEMGTLCLQQIVQLQSTAAANANPVNIAIYAWAEDVELWGPTGLTIQATDEYADSRKPSHYASVVADAAGKLSSVPVIGPYAMATSFAAAAISKVLRLFGWSNPPVITGVQGNFPKVPLFNPNPLLSYQDDVVALDPKNEVTVDPRTVGAQPDDDLIISKFCARESYIDSFVWNESDTSTTVLALLPVQPVYARATWVNNSTITNSVNCARVTMTPATYAAQLFQYWRGTFCLRVKVICSQFHRGRLTITWDPAAVVAGTTSGDGTVYTQVMDIASCDELVFRVPMSAATGLLLVNNYPSTVNTSAGCNYKLWGNRANTTDLVDTAAFCNGMVQISVLNGLQVADATAPATLVVSSWFEDMQFHTPRNDSCRPSYYGLWEQKGLNNLAFNNLVIQSLDMPIVVPVNPEMDVRPGGPAPDVSDVVVQGTEEPDGTEQEVTIPAQDPTTLFAALYSGEYMPSMRPFLHRSYLHRILCMNFTSGPNGVTYTMPRFPIPSGSKGTNYCDTGTGTTGTANGWTTNYVNTNPISYLTGCFVGYRGSMVWKAGGDEKGQIAPFSQWIMRAGEKGKGIATNVVSSADTQAKSYILKSFFGSFLGGTAYTDGFVSPAVTGVFPMYAPLRMFSGNVGIMYDALNASRRCYEFLQNDFLTYFGMGKSTGVCNIYISVAAGSDFNMFEFVNCPEVYAPTSFTP